MKSLDDMTKEIQEEFIKVINKSVPNDYIRFWEPAERITDDEIFEKYDTIYNAWVTYTYKKGSKKPSITAIIGRDFDATYNKLLNLTLLNLNSENIKKIKFWGKAAASCINQYLLDRNDYFLREVRFDFISDITGKAHFVVPNIPLMNVHFSERPRSPIISAENYAKERFEDYKAALEFQSKKPS